MKISFKKTTTQNLSIDQLIVGALNHLIGAYSFTTDQIALDHFDVKIVNADDFRTSITNVNLYKNNMIVLSLDLNTDPASNTIFFEISKSQKFHFVYFCLLFKFFYQYIQQNTSFQKMILCTSRYNCYPFEKLFGFRIIGHEHQIFYLQFTTTESLQNIWEEYYGSDIEENLYNFILPVEAGGYVSSNVNLEKPNEEIKMNHFKQTEKVLCESEQPLAEIKVGYNLFPISIRDLSSKGVAFTAQTTPDNPLRPDLHLQHIYSVWVKDNANKINWSNLTLQIVWKKDHLYGCRIIDNSVSWSRYIAVNQVKSHQRLTFAERTTA